MKSNTDFKKRTRGAYVGIRKGAQHGGRLHLVVGGRCLRTYSRDALPERLRRPIGYGCFFQIFPQWL